MCVTVVRITFIRPVKWMNQLTKEALLHQFMSCVRLLSRNLVGRYHWTETWSWGWMNLTCSAEPPHGHSKRLSWKGGGDKRIGFNQCMKKCMKRQVHHSPPNICWMFSLHETFLFSFFKWALISWRQAIKVFGEWRFRVGRKLKSRDKSWNQKVLKSSFQNLKNNLSGNLNYIFDIFQNCDLRKRTLIFPFKTTKYT